MLENLLFSANMSLPLFVLLGLGFVLYRKGLFSDDYIARTTDLVYYVFLPGQLFLDVATMDFAAAMDGRYMAVTVAGVVLQFLVAWICGNLLCRDRSKQGAFSHACFRGNFVYLGMALLQNIYGASSVASTAVLLMLMLPLYNVQGAILLSVKGNRGGVRLSAILWSILKNPMVLAILAGLPFAYFQIPLPFVAEKSLEYLQSATSTMALLVVGARIRPEALRSDLPLLLRLSAVKLLIMPAILAATAVAAGLTAEQTVTLTVAGAMPTAVNVYIITGKMGGDADLACGAVVVTHLLSLLTMTGIVFLLRTAGVL